MAERARNQMQVVSILDIDLDVFLEPRPYQRSQQDRLSASEYRAWSPQAVEQFLVERCNLSKENPIPGAIVTYHHELFDIWNTLIDKDELPVPFSLTHVDSHADMGMGDPSHVYIMCDLLHGALPARRNPKRDDAYGLSEGNYLSFALACRWIEELKYVQHPQTRDQNHSGLPDIGDSYFKDFDPNCGTIQLKAYSPGAIDGIKSYSEIGPPISLEPEVPIEFHDRDSFQSSDSFSLLFAAQSPNYTPATSDSILPTIRKFIRPI